MSIKVESTTDTPEDVMAAQGNLSKDVEVEKKPAPEKSDEKELPASEADTSSDDETDENDSDESEETQGTEEKPKKKKSGFKKRIDKLNSRLSEREREIAFLREQMAKTAQPKEEVAQKSESKGDGEPNPDDFETIKDYTRAVAKWELAQDKKLQAEQELKSKQQKEVEAHNKRVEAFAKSQDDFWDVIEDVDDIQASEPLQQLILESDLGPQLMYEIASNREEFLRLNALNERSLAREIGKLEAKLSSSKEVYQETKKPTKTPAPLKTVGNKSSGTSTKSPDEMDFHEYKKWRAANS